MTLPLPLLQERLLGKAMAFADEKAREIIEMEVGSRATPEAHAAKPKGSSLLLLCIGPQRLPGAACTARRGAAPANQVDELHLMWHTLQHTC